MAMALRPVVFVDLVVLVGLRIGAAFLVRICEWL